MGREAYKTAESSIPASRLRAVTPSDSANIEICRGLYVSVGGDVKVLGAEDDTPVTLAAVASGAILPFQVKRVYATGTTATSIVALY